MNWTPLPVAPCGLGESPMWHPVTHRLYWCDIPAGTLHEWNPGDQTHRRWSLGSDAACCAPVSDGTLLLALRRALVHFDPRTGDVQDLVAAPYDPALERFNDGKVDPSGRFWVGTLYEPRQPALARVYRLDWSASAARLHVMAEGVTVSNGLAFSLAGDRPSAWRSDTTSHTIWRADWHRETGEVGPWQTWAQFERRQEGQPLTEYGGRPDGAAVDQEGCYWVALYEGRQLLRLSPAGEVLERLEVPVRCPTMPCFGGEDGRTLFITSARDKRPEAELQAEPWAGCVLQTRVSVPGAPLFCVTRPVRT